MRVLVTGATGFIGGNLVRELPTTPIGPFDIKPTPTGKIIVDFINGRMPACVNTGLNVIDVRDVAKGHILAMERGRIGERYILGNKNLTLREIFSILERLTKIKAPWLNIPIWSAMAVAYTDEFVCGRIFNRHPQVPIAAVKAAHKFRHFDCSRAIQELGLPQTPVEEAFKEAIRWFRQNGYVRNSTGGERRANEGEDRNQGRYPHNQIFRRCSGKSH